MFDNPIKRSFRGALFSCFHAALRSAWDCLGPWNPVGNPLELAGSVSSGVAIELRLNCRMRRRLASSKQEEVSVSHSCSSKGLLIVENAG